MKRWVWAGAAACALAGCTQVSEVERPAVAAAPASEDAAIADIVSRMSLERKVAQLIQPQINSFTAEDMARYRFGSYLNGGNGGPYGDEFAPPSEWLRLADEMFVASTQPLPDGEPVIPTMWGTDAVHGHTNVIGATIFPHNIGLGATRDADLLRRIGRATAREIEATGIDWNFSPTVAVARDDRWGRTYESYSEDPQIVAPLGVALVEGLQGIPGEDDFLGDGRVIATAKHFFGDGGTTQGIDTGDVNGDIDALKAIHAVPYPPAIDAGVQVVMASFNSINGVKMHGNEALLTGVLRDEMGFDGVVVGDWNGHGQVKGCTVTDCAQSLKAGLDIYMVPDDWKGLMDTLIAQVRDGTIPMATLDRAVTRILRVKMRAGLLDADVARPSERGLGRDLSVIGSAEHRAIAREAVAKSQVILKNSGVLPLKQGSNILIAGEAADQVWRAAGGWTLSWQGGPDLTEDYFPGATSIRDGIEQAAREAGGAATYSADGSYADAPDVAVVVFGEEAYAEFYGDRKTLVFRDEEGLELLRKFDEAGIPTVAVFLSGRPLWMNREINAADAFVASWLPGGEGAGVADILFGKREATGKLSFSWPADCGGKPVNGSDGALFNVGYGLGLTQPSSLATLSEDCAYLDEAPSADWFASGRLAGDVEATAGGVALVGLRGNAGGIAARGIDRLRQEDAREIEFSPGASLRLSGPASEGAAYRIAYSLPAAPTAPVTIQVGDTVLDVTDEFRVGGGKGWREMVLTQSCIANLGDSITITSEGPLTMQIAGIARQDMPEGADCSF
ncbi:glycoside hydrolase family 3 N-terminal domain-containing protein [Qipengyuania sp. XHP0207]|uniref:glycoside hydrolase family 3 protein n=1 Tax=Qipengyuania sp. XHP0207 TaxID=3038078 RepID=UPI0024201D6E|nr:glycoside hydrolase family 3 protein [Qipengyuania sp. XHP0207]MDG5746828.1 glycoside hydrolase family 3 N-terminal domain-containing protein [Qipengyuania sp. XHP0207]